MPSRPATCTDYTSDDGEIIETTKQANVSRKRSDTLDKFPTVINDRSSDSGYSSHTIITNASETSSKSIKADNADLLSTVASEAYSHPPTCKDYDIIIKDGHKYKKCRDPKCPMRHKNPKSTSTSNLDVSPPPQPPYAPPSLSHKREKSTTSTPLSSTSKQKGSTHPAPVSPVSPPRQISPARQQSRSRDAKRQQSRSRELKREEPRSRTRPRPQSYNQPQPQPRAVSAHPSAPPQYPLNPPHPPPYHGPPPNYGQHPISQSNQNLHPFSNTRFDSQSAMPTLVTNNISARRYNPSTDHATTTPNLSARTPTDLAFMKDQTYDTLEQECLEDFDQENEIEYPAHIDGPTTDMDQYQRRQAALQSAQALRNAQARALRNQRDAEFMPPPLVPVQRPNPKPALSMRQTSSNVLPFEQLVHDMGNLSIGRPSLNPLGPSAKMPHTQPTFARDISNGTNRAQSTNRGRSNSYYAGESDQQLLAQYDRFEAKLAPHFDHHASYQHQDPAWLPDPRGLQRRPSMDDEARLHEARHHIMSRTKSQASSNQSQAHIASAEEAQVQARRSKRSSKDPSPHPSHRRRESNASLSHKESEDGFRMKLNHAQTYEIDVGGQRVNIRPGNKGNMEFIVSGKRELGYATNEESSASTPTAGVGRRSSIRASRYEDNGLSMEEHSRTSRRDTSRRRRTENSTPAPSRRAPSRPQDEEYMAHQFMRPVPVTNKRASYAGYIEPASPRFRYPEFPA